MFEKSLPLKVKPTGDFGCYDVESFTDDKTYRYDVIALRCNCRNDETAVNAIRRDLGYLPYENICKHGKLALPYHAMVLNELLIRKKMV